MVTRSESQAPKQTWFCASCGSTDVKHDAVVQWDPVREDWEVLNVLDDAWCEPCSENGLAERGTPVFGIPPENEAAAPTEPSDR